MAQSLQLKNVKSNRPLSDPLAPALPSAPKYTGTPHSPRPVSPPNRNPSTPNAIRKVAAAEHARRKAAAAEHARGNSPRTPRSRRRARLPPALSTGRHLSPGSPPSEHVRRRPPPAPSPFPSCSTRRGNGARLSTTWGPPSVLASKTSSGAAGRRLPSAAPESPRPSLPTSPLATLAGDDHPQDIRYSLPLVLPSCPSCCAKPCART